MSYDFDLEAAIDNIATLEAAIATPTPGVTNSYGYNSNPVEITDLSALPAIVHVPLGPQTEGEGAVPGLMAVRGNYQLSYEIYSRLLVIEAVPDQYPADEGVANLFWKSVAETFFNYDNAVTLTNAASAHTYACIFPPQSYQPRRWPPVPTSTHWYWSLQYVHRFVFVGG